MCFCYDFYSEVPVRLVSRFQSLHMSQVAHQACAYPGFCRMEYFFFPLNGILVHCRVTPAVKLAVPVYTPAGWREAL